MMSQRKHSAAEDSVHFRAAELLEQAESVQDVDIAVLAMQVVGMMQEGSILPLESVVQQPCTPYRVLVAQMWFELEHVIEEAVGRSVSLEQLSDRLEVRTL
jgi:hypothetical protein